MNRGGAEAQRENQITETVIGCAIEVHRTLGPGLLESAYEECLCYELSSQAPRQVGLPVACKNIKLYCGYMLDLLVEGMVIIELKAVEKLAPVHDAQLLTYLKRYPCAVGLLVDFNVPLLRQGIKRLVNQFHESSAPPRLCG